MQRLYPADSDPRFVFRWPLNNKQSSNNVSGPLPLTLATSPAIYQIPGFWLCCESPDFFDFGDIIPLSVALWDIFNLFYKAPNKLRIMIDYKKCNFLFVIKYNLANVKADFHDKPTPYFNSD